jgi:hypothetical protein
MKYVARPFRCFKFDARLKDGILFKTLHNAVCVYLYGSVSTFRYDNLFQVCNTVYGVRRLIDLTLSQLMLHICRVSKTLGEWYQKTHKTEDTNKLILFVSSVLFVFWYHSPKILDTPHIWSSL